MRCEQCGCEFEELYEMLGSKCCDDCWHDYWQDNNIGEDTSFSDFLEFTLTKITKNKDKTK